MSPTRQALRGALAAFERRALDAEGRRLAAVAIAVVRDGPAEDPPAVLLTRRAGGLRRHSGQWALPGGRLDPGETAEDAARRELAEELGLELPAESVLGLLDDYPTRSGFVVTPVVVWGGEAGELRPDPGEVAAVYRVPWAELGRPEAVHLIPSGGEQPLLALELLDTMIFAPTAAILHQFAELAVHGRSTRVDRFEQPRFAWK